MKYFLMLFCLAAGFFIGINVDNFTQSVDMSKASEKGQYAALYESFDILANQGVNLDKRIVLSVLSDVKEKKGKLTPEEISIAKSVLFSDSQKIADKIAAKALVDSKNYLATQKNQNGIQSTQSGLMFQVIKDGTGNAPAKTDWIALSYEGRLQNGQVFESSKTSGGVVRVPLTNLLPGLQEALVKMKPGSEWKVIVPPELGYGSRVRPGLPANSVLVFDLTLHSVLRR